MDHIISYFKSSPSDSNYNSELIKINNVLNTINTNFSLSHKINTPTLVTVGSQSSGKSTILNRILNLDIIPVGSVMETRTPINIELIHSTTDYYIEFGNYSSSKWTSTKKIYFNTTPSQLNINDINKEIKALTEHYAGNTMNISSKEINIKLYSPYVSDLNFIDLPGLTMIACTDKGQPKDIKKQIRDLVISYIKNKNAIIMCVIPAREDLEADIALELVKEHDIDGSRTIGVLTKIDLMNRNNSIAHYILNNNVSKDLQLYYGYYAIKNDSKYTFDKQTEHEENYFKNHSLYSDIINTNRFGVERLKTSLSHIFIEKIKKNIPSILHTIETILKENNTKLLELGTELPSSDDNKMFILTKHMSTITQHFTDNINNRCSTLNTGSFIKEAFTQFKENIDKLEPFSAEMCSNEKLNTIIKKSDGNHMSLPIPTIEVIEACILDSSIDCFKTFLPFSIQINDTISSILKKLIETLLKEQGLHNYTELYSKLLHSITIDIINKCNLETKRKIKDIIFMENNYIWTDDPDFKKALLTISKNNINSDNLRNILTEYFNCTKKIIKHQIPKVIMYHNIREVQIQLNVYLLNKINHSSILNIFTESSAIKQKRESIKTLNSILTNAKTILET